MTSALIEPVSASPGQGEGVEIVRVHIPAATSTEVGEDGVLDAGDILPGFTLGLREWFEESE